MKLKLEIVKVRSLVLVPGVYCRCCCYYPVLLFMIFTRVFYSSVAEFSHGAACSSQALMTSTSKSRV